MKDVLHGARRRASVLGNRHHPGGGKPGWQLWQVENPTSSDWDGKLTGSRKSVSKKEKGEGGKEGGRCGATGRRETSWNY